MPLPKNGYELVPEYSEIDLSSTIGDDHAFPESSGFGVSATAAATAGNGYERVPKYSEIAATSVRNGYKYAPKYTEIDIFSDNIYDDRSEFRALWDDMVMLAKNHPSDLAVSIVIAVVASVMLVMCTHVLGDYLVSLSTYKFDFQLKYVAVSPLNVSSASHQLRANWNISLYLGNLNSNLIIYDIAKVAIYYINQTESLAASYVAPFRQHGMSNTTLNVILKSRYVGVVEELVDALKTAEKYRNCMDFKLTFETNILVRPNWGSRSFNRYVCDNVKIAFSSDNTTNLIGRMVGGPIKCGIPDYENADLVYGSKLHA